MQVQGILIERDSISRIEIGTRFIPDYELPVFSNVLGVSVAWLLGMEELNSIPFFLSEKGGLLQKRSAAESAGGVTFGSICYFAAP